MSKGLGRGLEGLFEDNAPLIDKIDEKQLLFVKISNVEPTGINRVRRLTNKRSKSYPPLLQTEDFCSLS